MTKLIPCKVCGETIAPSAEFCPHCGAKPRKHQRLLSAIAVGGILIAAIFIISSRDDERGSQPSPEKGPAQTDSEKPAPPLDKNEQLKRRLAEIEHTPASQLTASELGPIYNLVSEFTDVQRENKTKVIIGQIVDWTLPVYEVTKTEPNIYRIQTEAKEGIVGTIATVNTRSDLQRDYVERLKWHSLIHIKGRITGVGVFVRQLNLDDAIVFAPASEPHVSEIR